MDQAAEPRIIISFNSIAKVVGLDPTDKQNWKAADKKKITDEIQERFDAWVNNVGPFSSAGMAEEVDPAFAKRAPKLLHGIFKVLGNKVKLDGVATTFAMQSQNDTDTLDFVRHQLKLLAESDSETWFIGRGPSPDFIRLKDERGKAAGEKPEQKQSAPSSEGVQRFTARVKDLGFKTKGEFEKAKKDLGTDAPTMAQLKTWLGER